MLGIRLRGLTPSNRAHAAIAARNNMNSARKTQNRRWFKLAVAGEQVAW